MRKLLFLILLSGIFALSSCGPRPDQEALQGFSEADPSGLQVSFAFQAGRQLQEVWIGLAQQFSRENPWGIQVIPRNYDFLTNPAWEMAEEGIPGLVLTGLDEGSSQPFQGADLFPLLFHPEWGFSWEPDGEIRDHYLIKEEVWKLPFLPLLRDTDLLYVNLSARAVPEDPRTVWREGGFVFPLDESALATIHFALGGLMRNRRGELLEDPKTWDETRSLITEALEEGLALPEIEKFQGQIDFASGVSPVAMDTLSGLSYYRRSLEAFGSSFPWDAVIYPYDVKKGGMNLRDLGIQIIPGRPSEVLAAWLFYRWLMTPEIQADLAEVTGLLPVNGRAAAFLGSRGDSVYLRILEEYLSAPRRIYPQTPGSQEFLSALVESLAEDAGGFSR